MSDTYLTQILARERVDNSATSPALAAANTLLPALRTWGNGYLAAIQPSGSYAKGTANRSGTDIDLFLSLSNGTPGTLKEAYDSLANAMTASGYSPRKQNVSIGIRVGGYDVDLVPAKRQNDFSTDHSLYRRKADNWTKTNVDTHVAKVTGSWRADAIRILKLWRNQKNLDWPSFYLELITIDALAGTSLSMSQQVVHALTYIRDRLENARIVDPANTANIISDDLSGAAKRAIASAAASGLSGTWESLVK
jgi:hypothetical protein